MVQPGRLCVDAAAAAARAIEQCEREADAILQDRGIMVIPDILANAGGVIVSYFEWAQDAQRFSWEEAHIHSRLRTIITQAFHRIFQQAVDKKVTMRTAALISGIEEVAKAHQCRGLYP